jgi:hypothetical protein
MDRILGSFSLLLRQTVQPFVHEFMTVAYGPANENARSLYPNWFSFGFDARRPTFEASLLAR